MAELIRSTLDQMTVSPFAVHAPSNFQITESIKLTQMTMPNLELTLDIEAQTATFTLDPGLYTVEEATVALMKAATLLYSNTELISELDGTPALIIRMFVWTNKENG